MVRYLLPFAISLVLADLAAQEFEVGTDFEVRSAVEPGLIRHPVMATLDDRGRLFVAENAGVNLKKEELLAETPNSVRLLEDTDGDGVYDKATTFADKLTFPQGALWVYDSLYVMSPPSLWRFADEDGDGVAELREELATGFDFTGNAADVHGPFLHPNGRIYWCHGRKGHAVPDPDTGAILYEGKGARIWSSTIGGSDVEPFAGGGMDNPVEIDFTEEGEIIGTVNLFYGRPRGDTLTYWIHGGAYPRRDQKQVLEEFTRTGDLLPEVHNFGHVAVSGMTRYRSGRLSEDWQDNWIVSHFNTARLTRTRFVREGAGFVAAETEEIFELKSPDAHLTDVLEDHNGDLLAIDTGGWFRIGCPTSHIAKPEVPGGIYRISRAGHAYERPTYPDWSRLPAEAVAGFLGSEEEWLVDRANLELAVRGDPALPELRRILDSSKSPSERRNAVWTLSRMKFSESVDLVYQALKDPDASVRQAACNAISVTRTWQSIATNEPAEREIELERNRTISGALAGIVRSDEAPVAREAATALGRMGEFRAIGALIGRLGRSGSDRMLQHALIYALIEIDDAEATRSGLSSENPDILSGVLQALDQMPSGSLEVLDVLPHLDSDHPSLHSTVVAIAGRNPAWDAALANRFHEWTSDLTPTRVEVLTSLVPSHATAPPIRDFLGHLLTTDASRTLGLALASSSEISELPPEWEPSIASALSPGADPEQRDLALRLLGNAPSEAFATQLRVLAENEGIPILTRIHAARATSGRNAVLGDSAFALLSGVIENEQDVSTRSEAVAILTQARLTREMRTKLAGITGHFSPIEVQALFQIFRRIDDEEQARILGEELAGSSAFASLDTDRLRQLYRPFSEEARRPIEKRIEEVEAEASQRKGRIDSLVSSVEKGDPSAGKAVFGSGKGSCVVCHRIGETGGKVGPDLSTIGRIRSARDLYESILYPTESIARDFNTYEIQMRDGSSSLIGLIESESSSEVTLIDPAGQSRTISRGKIASIVEIPTSLMPPGLEQTMQPEELRDLVAYLLSLR